MPTARRATAGAIAPIDWAAACERAGLPRPPVGYLPLGGGYGTADVSPNRHHGTPQGGAAPTGSPWGGAFDFSVNDSWVDAGTILDFDAQTQAFSWASWFRCPSTSSSKYGTGTGLADGWYWRVDYGRTSGGILIKIDEGGNDAFTGAGSGYDDGQWHHIVCRLDPANVWEAYVDGEELISLSVGSVGNLADQIAIGIRAPNDFSAQWQGDLAECLLFNYFISPSQIRWLYNHPRGLLQPTSRIEQWAAIGGAGGVSLAGTALGTASATPILQVEKVLSGTSTGTASAAATLLVEKVMSGIASGEAVTDPALYIEKVMSGTATGSALTSGDLKVVSAIQLSGTATGSADTSGTLEVKKQLLGQLKAEASASGQLDVVKQLMATATGKAALEGDVLVEKPLSGTAEGQAEATGALEVKKQLAGELRAEASASAQIEIVRELAGSAVGTSQAEADLLVEKAMSGSAVATADITAALLVGEIYEIPPFELTATVSRHSAEAEVSRHSAEAEVSRHSAEAEVP